MLVSADAVDMARYLEAQASMSVRRPRELWKSLQAAMFGERVAGCSMPWRKLDGRFDLRPGEVTVWTGYKGHGKSLALSHVMLAAMAQQERVGIISPEFRAIEIIRRKVVQASQGPNPSEAFARQAVDWMEGRLWVLDHQGLTPWRHVIGCLRYMHERFDITQAVVDSLMKCGIGPDDFGAQKEFVDRLQTFAHDTGCHVHLVAHARKASDDSKPAELHDVKGASEICDMAENVVSVWKNKRKQKDRSMGRENDDEDALFIVDSQRNGNWTGALRLWFNPCGQFLESPSLSPMEYVL